MSHVGTDTRIGLCLYRQNRDHRNAPVEVRPSNLQRTSTMLQPVRFGTRGRGEGMKGDEGKGRRRGGGEGVKGGLFTPKESSLSSAAVSLPPSSSSPPTGSPRAFARFCNAARRSSSSAVASAATTADTDSGISPLPSVLLFPAALAQSLLSFIVLSFRVLFVFFLRL